jgi:hypothetical protein
VRIRGSENREEVRTIFSVWILNFRFYFILLYFVLFLFLFFSFPIGFNFYLSEQDVQHVFLSIGNNVHQNNNIIIISVPYKLP